MALSSRTKALAGIAIVAVVILSAVYIYSVSSEDDDVKSNLNPFTTKYDIGAINSTGGSVTGTGKYSEGSTATLNANPQTGYSFVGWYENGKLHSSNSILKIKVDSSHTFTPKFEKNIYSIATSSNYPNAGMVSGGGKAYYGDSATLNATLNSGYSFDGWYDGSTLLSKNQSYYHNVTNTTTIQAKYSIVHDASFTISQSSSKSPSVIGVVSTYNVEITNRVWNFTDAITNATVANNTTYGNGQPSYSLGISGGGKAVKVTQTVTYSDGQKATSSKVAVVDETITKTFSWKYHENDWTTMWRDWLNIDHKNNRSASFTWNLNFSTYYQYYSKDVTRSYNVSVLGSYVTYADAYIVSLAKFFNEQTSGWSDLQTVNYVLKFVQSITYAYDIDNNGKLEYYSFPYETLWKQKGDCEDHAILFVSIMKAMGYRCALIDAPSHVLAAIDLSDGTGSYTTYNGVKYYFCEATSDSGSTTNNWANVGYLNSDYAGKTSVVWTG